MHDKVLVIEKEKSSKKRNVCAYARVSTTSDLQELSFDAQVQYYTDYINKNETWNFVGVYTDEGKSGTSLKRRDGFMKMVEACEHGLIDLIITKSVSRFARNTLDSLKMLQVLKQHGTEVWFENHNMSSFDPKIEMMLSVLSGIAEEESRSISQNVKWGLQKRFEEGKFHMVTSTLLGYDRDKNGYIVINEEEAKIVRKIYELFLLGLGAYEIIKHLEDKEIKTVRGNTHWNKSAIHGILTNEKYTGNALLQKTFKESYLSKRKKTNRGELPMFYVIDSHPAIISKETFNDVQKIRKERTIKYQKSDKKDVVKTFSTTSIYHKMFYCYHCGSHYQNRSKKVGSFLNGGYLQCYLNTEKKRCPSETIPINIVNQHIINQFNLILKNKSKFLQLLKRSFESEEQVMNAKEDLERTQAKLEALDWKLHEMMTLVDDFHEAIKYELKNQRITLQQEKTRLENRLHIELNNPIYINKVRTYMNQFSEAVNSLDDFDYKAVFSKIIVVSRNEFIFLVGARKDYQNVDTNKERLLSGSLEYKFRETTFKSMHGLLFF